MNGYDHASAVRRNTENKRNKNISEWNTFKITMKETGCLLTSTE
jgi:hypothetical protein